MLELIDIGANLTNSSFRDDMDEVISSAQDAGVVGIVLTGTSERESVNAEALARTRPEMFRSTAGVHPHDAKSWTDDTAAKIRELAGCSAVAAIGECGLDYNRNYSPPAKQREVFEHQLSLAAELRMPVFLHERDAHDDFARIVGAWRSKLVGGVVHCFTGSAEALAHYIELDLHIGITGWICDERRGKHLMDSVGIIPPNRLMIETDAPYLLPRTIRPKPKGRRNEPKHLRWVLEALAQARGESPDDVAVATTQTARTFFQWDPK